MKYKEIYGNFDVPSTFAIPESELWPEYSYYLNLGKICSRINKHQSWVSKHEELQKIGYIVPNHPKRVKKKNTWDKKTNFGGGIELLMNEKKSDSRGQTSDIDIEDLIDEDDTEYQLDKESFLNQVNSLLDSIEITEEQREIFEMKFNDYSYSEIKDKLNVSKSRIANTINGTISKMKNEMNKKYYYKVVKIDGTSRYYFFKDLNQASKQARTYFGKAKKLIDDNGYAIINGWKIYK